MMKTLEIKIDTDYIPAMNLLKLAGLADAGGQAAYLIIQGKVLLDGVRITEKRKKIYPGSVVTVENQCDLLIRKENEN